MRNFNLLSWRDVSTTLAMTVGSPSIDRRGTMLKHVAFLLLFLFTLGIGNSWGAVTNKKAEWAFTSESYPSNNSNFGATSGAYSSGSNFKITNTTTGWKDGSRFKFTTSANAANFLVSVKLGDAIPSGTQVTLKMSVWYNKAKNAPLTGAGIKVSTNGSSYSTTGVGTTSWTLGTSETEYSCVYTTQANLAANTVIYFQLTGSGRAGQGEGYCSGASITVPVEDAAPTYTITPLSSNNSYGTVSLNGSVITATPNEGYHIDDDDPYTVTSGTATVVRGTGDNINKFTVTPTSNCTVRINFEAIPTYTVTLKDDESTLPQASAGASVTLPSRAGCPTQGYTFAGWSTTNNTSWTTTAPTIIPAGEYTPTADVNLYPVYTKQEGEGTKQYAVTRTLTVGKTYVFGAVKAAANASLANNTTFGAVAFTQAYNTTYPNWGARVDLTPDAYGVLKGSDTTNLTAACKWTLDSIKSGRYVFKNSSGYLRLGTLKGNTTNGAQCGTSTTMGNVYMQDVNSTCKDAFLLHPTTPSSDANIMLYNTSSSGYRMYTSSQGFSNTMTPYVRFYEYDPGTPTYYMTSLECCTELASINGSFNEATQVTGVLKWKQLSDQVSSWAVTYREKNSGNAFAAVTTSSTTTETIETVEYNKYTISGLAAGKTYEFKLTPTLKTGVCPLSEDLIVEGSTQAAYTITAASSNTNHGTVSLNGVVITATPAAGYGYASPAYTVSPANSATVAQEGNEFTVTPSANTTVTINFVQQNYAVTMAKSPANADVTISANQSNKHYGDQITVSVTNHDGYMFDGWEASPAVTFADASAESTTFSMPASNVTVTAKFIKVLTVAEARDVIDNGSAEDKTGVYVKGIISKIDSYSSNYSSITYWISDDGTTSTQLEVFGGLAGNFKSAFEAKTDLLVGDEVVVTGNITYYTNNSVYEFEANNTIYTLKRLNSISVKNAPTKVEYTANEQFDPAGLVITLNYIGTNNVSEDVAYNNTTAAGFTFSPTTSADLNATNTAVTITYKGKSVDQAITVSRIATELGWSAASYEATQGDDYSFPTLTIITPAAIASSVTYSSTNTDVATINASGVITVKTHGTTTIKADFAQTNVYAAATTASYTLTINEDMTPRLVVDPSSLTFTDTPKDDAEGKTFNLVGTHLTANATLAITGTNASMFSVTESVAKDGNGAINTNVTVTYTPTTAGSHTATLTISSTGASDVTVALSGSALETDLYKSALHTSETAWTDYADGVKKAGTGYNVPNPGSVTKGSDNCEGNHYRFAGWVEDADKEAPSGHIVAASGTKNAAGKVYWAVWEKETATGPDTYEMTTSVAVNDVVVIAEIDDVAEGKAGKELSGFSSTSTVYGTHSDFTTLPAGTLEWTVEEGYNKTGVAFQNGDNYLYWGSGNSLNVNATLSANTSWTVETNSERAKITNNGTNTRVICWNEGSPRFAAYNSKNHGDVVQANQDPKYYYPVFYKKVPGVVYGDPITYCCTPHDITISNAIEHGTVEADLESACAGIEVELTATPDEGYEFVSWAVTYVDGESQTQPVSVTNNKFLMPDFETTVSATFTKIAVTGVTINGYSSVAKGDNITLTLDITPSTARPTVVWSSSNDAIATVVDGVVTGEAQGSVTITAKVDGTDYTKDITVTRETKLNSITVVNPKTTYTLNEAFVAPQVNANYLYVDDESEAPTVENVDGATFTGFDNQTAVAEQTITVNYGSKSTTYTIAVSAWMLNLQTQAQTGPSTVTPATTQVTINTYGSEIDLTDYYVNNLCEEYTQVGFIASSTDVDSDEEPENLLTAYTPTADNQTLYAVFSHTGYTGKVLVEEDLSDQEVYDVTFPSAGRTNAEIDGGSFKLGTSKNGGSITTKALTGLNHNFKVELTAKRWNNDKDANAEVCVTFNGTTKQSGTGLSTSDFNSYTFEFDGSDQANTIVIASLSQGERRIYVDDIQIYTLDEVGYTSVYDCRSDMTVTYAIATADAEAGATGACTAETVKQGNDYTVCTDEPTWAGHEFAGWSDGENIVGATIENVQSAITLTATWMEIVASSITIESDDITAGAMTIDDGRTATLTVTFDPTDTYNKTLTWSEDSHYTITDNGDGTYNLKADNYTTAPLTVTATTANSKSASFTLTINQATKLTGLTLEGLTTANTVYTIGDEFSTEGVVVNTTVNVGEAPQNVDATFSEPDMTTSGVKTITVEYEHAEYGPASTTYEITVNPWSVKLYKNESLISDVEITSTSQTVTLPTEATEGWASKVSGYHLAGFAKAIDAIAPSYAPGATYTPTGNATLYGLYTANMPTYTLISSADDLEIGRSIIIATKDAAQQDSKHYAIGELNYTQNGQSNNRKGVEVTKGNEGTTLAAYAGATEFILMAGKETGTYALYDPINGKYMCAQTSNSNYLKLEEELSANGSWTITPNSVVSNTTGNRKHLYFNYNNGEGNSRLFSCYAQNAQNMNDIAVYQSDVPVKYDLTQDLIIASDQTLNTADVDQSVNVIVKDGVKLTVGSALTINDFTMESRAGSSGQLIGTNVSVNGNIYMDVKFYTPATLDETSANQWYMISAPFAVNLNGGFLQTDGTAMVFGTDFDIFAYDGAKRAETGVTGWKRPQGQMPAGTACLIGFNERQSTTIRLKAASNTISDPTSIGLSEYTEAVDAEGANSNWNGVANPTMHYITLDDAELSVQVFENDEENRGYQPYSASGNSFVVGTAFFIHRAEDVNLSSTINSSLRTPKRATLADKYEYCVQITREGATTFANQMYVRASEEASAQYEYGRDVETLNGTTAKHALIWTDNYNKRLAVEEAPLVNNQANYELSLYAPNAGVYTISVPTTREDASLYLTKDGAIIWDLTMSPYEAELVKGSNSGYGLLLQARAPQIATGVEDVQGDKVQCTKVVINDNIFILRGEKLYDVTGKAVK